MSSATPESWIAVSTPLVLLWLIVGRFTFQRHEIILMLALILGTLSCGRRDQDAFASKSASSRTAVVERRDLDFTIEVVGDLRPSVQVDVKAEISGRVKKIQPSIGATIKRGEIVVELDDTDLLTEKASTKIEIDGATLSLEKAALADGRAKQLVAEDLIAKADADNLRLDASIAKNNLEKAVKKLQSVEDKLSKTRIAAPITGTVINLPIVEGQVVVGGPSVSTGTLLLTLANLSEMLISTHVNEVDVTRMKEGQPVQVTVDAFEGMDLTGAVHFIAPVASVRNNIKGFAVDVLVSRSDPRIRPGMSANVKVPIAKAAGVLSIPIEAVFREGNKRFVYLKNGDSFDRCEVEVGVVTSDRAEIKAGLKEGDTISLVRPKDDARKG